MTDTFKYVQSIPTTLAGAGASSGDTSLILTSLEDINGNTLAMTDFGTILFGTIEPNSGDNQESISATGVTVNGDGTVTLTGVKTVLPKAPYTQTSGLSKTHAGGVTFVISNTAAFYDKLTSKNDDETIAGTWTFTSPNYPRMDVTTAAPTDDAQLATKKYVDDTAVSGAPDMDLTTKGIGEEATAAEINSGTQAGGTLAQLVVNPKFLKDSIYYSQLPSSDEKAAIAAGASPTALNPFITQSVNALNELVANKDTTTTLGTSDVKYPSQNAVKTYVDTNAPLTALPNDWIASDTLRQSADTERNTSSGTPAKLKEIRISGLGTVRVKVDGKSVTGTMGYYLAIYKNGSSEHVFSNGGDTYTTYHTYSYDVTGLKPGDLIQIYANGDGAGHNAYVQNFRIYGDVTVPFLVNTN